MERMDVRVSDTIVCYDSHSMLAASRAAWMLRAMGVENVHILNSTLQRWIKDGHPTVKGQEDNEAFSYQGLRKTQASAKSFHFKVNNSLL